MFLKNVINGFKWLLLCTQYKIYLDSVRIVENFYFTVFLVLDELTGLNLNLCLNVKEISCL